MEIITWLMIGFFIVVTLIFMAIAVFLPEWVGITGKKALEAMAEQNGDTAADSKKNTTDKQ